MTRSYESNGGDVKIRGTALHVAEKYVQLARDAQSSGDRVAAENYLQHAEHYYRIVAAAQAQMPQPQPVVRSDDDGADEEDRESRDNGSGGERRAMYGGDQPAFGLSDPQPYFNGGDQEQAVNDAGALPESGSGRDRGPHMGGFRRRRPYRERYGDRAGEHGEQGRSDGGAGPPQADD